MPRSSDDLRLLASWAGDRDDGLAVFPSLSLFGERARPLREPFRRTPSAVSVSDGTVSDCDELPDLSRSSIDVRLNFFLRSDIDGIFLCVCVC